MKETKKILFFVLFVFTNLLYCQISVSSWHSGIYILGASDLPFASNDYSYPFVKGGAVRVKWQTIEPSPGVYNWNFLDSEIATAKFWNKKISVSVLGAPDWIKDLGARTYEYIDNNSYHPTYGQVLSGYLTWDKIYIERIKNLISALAGKYSQEKTISYFNLVAGQISRNLPDTLASGELFYQKFIYHPDSLTAKMKEVLDHYMGLFPETPLWSSIDYVLFEPAATGLARNYAAKVYSDYGRENYPDRFGYWREDLSGCNPGYEISSGSQWYLMRENPERNGAQMLWHVQDGPVRMNKCDIVPNTKEVVLDSALKRGIALGMRYFEVYKGDIIDPVLYGVLHNISDSLDVIFGHPVSIDYEKGEIPRSFELFQNYPNPFNPSTQIKYSIPDTRRVAITVYDIMGRNIALLCDKVQDAGVYEIVLEKEELAAGIYFVVLNAGNERKVIKINLIK